MTEFEKPKIPQGEKMAIDLGPLLVFFAVNTAYGLMPATAALIAATLVALGISYTRHKHVPIMPLVAGALLTVFGGLTLYFDNDIFIKMKPTVVNTMFSIALFTGLVFKRNFLANVFGAVFHLDDDGWTKLTIRWAIFFLFLAALNEFIWRTQSPYFCGGAGPAYSAPCAGNGRVGPAHEQKYSDYRRILGHWRTLGLRDGAAGL